MSKKIFSGIQPSGNLHLGNYIGAISQWVDIQNQGNDCIFCIVDLHAITVPQDPKTLRKRIKEVAALYLAAGVDPEKSSIFVQSENPDHAVGCWILDCYTGMGQLSRMTQYKSKSEGIKELASVGLFNYPVLMAADILLYQTDEVPVGEDQVQHIELARDVAEKFNSKYGQVFTLPKPRLLTGGARIMSLQNPDNKMSKSYLDNNGIIDLLDDIDSARKKIMTAVTDSDNFVKFDLKNKKAISNLLTIYSCLSGKEISDIEEEYAGKGYKEFKQGLADVVAEFLKSFQEKYGKVTSDMDYLDEVLDEGLSKVKPISSKTLASMYDAIGLGR
jgi:tryptophanyl-tRNA synthetase